MAVHRVVGIAVVSHEGRYLVGVRQPGQSLAGFSEFPGGKCHRGELPRDAAVRECAEETGLTIEPIRELHRAQHMFRLGVLDLHFWLCRVKRTDEVRENHEGFRWIPLEQLSGMKFPDANHAVIRKLRTDDQTGRDTPSTSTEDDFGDGL